MSRKAHDLETVRRLWKGGERAAAALFAKAKKIPEKDWPEGLAGFVRRTRR